jgi:CDGSH-type Zn-finger protein
MARLTRREETGPRAIKVGGETKWICMCGLSKNEPFCDNSHDLCTDEDEDSLYEYTETGERILIHKDKNKKNKNSDEPLIEKLKRKAQEEDD